MPKKSTIAEARAIARELGFTIRRLSDTNEYRVNVPKGDEDTAYYTSDIEDAIDTMKVWKETMDGVEEIDTDYIRQLAGDFMESGMEATASDFESCAREIDRLRSEIQKFKSLSKHRTEDNKCLGCGGPWHTADRDSDGICERSMY